VRQVSTVPVLRNAIHEARVAGRRLVLVPTMGALHEGHLGLVRLAADHGDHTVVSIFVNPTQFDRREDLAAYPRDLEGDLEALQTLGDATPAVVFTPSAAEMYPRPPVTSVRVAELTERLCGATRPGHFDGVATVVTKLLHLVQPDAAVFGRKDFQQLQVVRRLVADLNLPVAIIGAPTVREHDGVAMSSRNRRLDAQGRQASRALSQALRAAVLAAREQRQSGGRLSSVAVREAADGVLSSAEGVEIDYLEVLKPDELAPAPRWLPVDAQLLVAVAAFIGEVRLIDNVAVGDAEDEQRLLAATRDG
jgi:pantoate--beta-alanine ligase